MLNKSSSRLFLPGLQPQPLPGDLVQNNAARHRSIQRIDLTLHRQCRHKVALLFHQSADSIALRADNQTYRTLKVQLAPIHPIHIGAGEPHIFLGLQALHSGHDIGDPDDRQAHCCPSGGLDCRRSKTGAVPLGDDDPMGPAGFRRTDNGA